MRATRFISTMLLTACICGAAGADDGAINNKSMSKNITIPDFTDPEITTVLPEAEHAFTSMMGFYVPAQQASGAPAGEAEDGLIPYCNIDNQPEPGQPCTAPLESLDVAKPLVNVFIYGPALEVENTAFAHSFMDTYGAISLDDGLTFKKTNLSETATDSSFDPDLQHIHGSGEEAPASHTAEDAVDKHGISHPLGYEAPFEAHCVECHGVALQGTSHVPGCYSCHNKVPPFEETFPDGLGPVLYSATLNGDELSGVGINAMPSAPLGIINGETGEEVDDTTASTDGDFSFSYTLTDDIRPPCTVAADAGDSVDVISPAVPVLDSSGTPVKQCQGHLSDGEDDPEGNAYPGGTYNVFHAVAGNRVLVAWPSRYCKKGQPAYSFAWDGDDEGLSEELLAKRDAVADELGIDVDKDLYLTDLFGVAGNQGSIDFAEEGYPQAGIVPFGCVWTARGILLPGDDPRTPDEETAHMVWTKAERLTSGRRDPNRIEVRGVPGAGFVMTWQEDPDGLRPGQGLGPGEGWSGAVAHDKTDIWYSFIPWEYFDLVENPDDVAGDPVAIVDHELSEVSGRPQVYVPMAVPMRLSNNDKCKAEEYGPGATPSDEKLFSYCNHDVAKDYGLQDFCADIVNVPQGPQSELGAICVNEDGLPNIANTASTRPRTSLQGYDSDGDGETDSAWVVVAAEESKGLGRFLFLPDGTACTEGEEPGGDYIEKDCDSDVGKNQWYFSFDMGDPATSDTEKEPYGLVQNLVSQGNMLNQPEIDWRTGEFYPVINTVDMWDFEGYNYDVYNTEIARRSSLLVQGIHKSRESGSHLLAMPSWKQGAMRQGGPADTMLRRFVLECGDPPEPVNGTDTAICHKDKETLWFDATKDADAIADHLDHGDYQGICQADLCPFEESIKFNPYAFENMVCDSWLVEAGENPYYPGGICGAPATNLSGVIPDVCIDDSDESDGTTDVCPTVDFSGSSYGIGDTNPILQGYIQGEGNTTRVLSWHQCPSDGVPQDESQLDGGYVDCANDDRTDEFVNLLDQSWYNPLDVSKGHRGFIDGDFVMFLYAWSPNWRLNAKGKDRYELYVRRSFDGGTTWTTLPGSFMASNGESYSGQGTVTCESYRIEGTGESSGGDGTPKPEPTLCFDFTAGAAEHARNVTQHKSLRTTTLDPRYSATRESITDTCLDNVALEDTGEWSCDDGSGMDSDLRNPSRYFMAYETGDNTTVVVGEAEPLDLFYSRAINFGDDYQVWAEEDDLSLCYPTDPHEVDIDEILIESGFCNEWDRMNRGGDSQSSEASLASNPDGSKMYGVWAQWVMDPDTHEDIEADAMARRIWWIDDYISDTEAWTLPGTSGGE